MTKVMITSNDHELHFAMWTVDQTPSWCGYFQMPKNVAIFSASQMKKPISTKLSVIGMLRSRSSGRKITTVRA